MRTVAIIGAGLIGQGWAIVFARRGWNVRLYDVQTQGLGQARELIVQQLAELQRYGLLDDMQAAADRVSIAESLQAALAGADYVQENSPERLEIKRAVFTELDRYAEPHAVIGSSTSSLPASEYTESLPGRHRCLVVHPVNPPYLIPLVELCGAPWTSPQTIETARRIMQELGQKPITVRHEIEGFVLNRLQGALLHEAFRLAAAGVASAEDIDTTIKDGLGLRWSFMGPFETIDLNAPAGLADYCARYGGLYQSIGATQSQPVPWDEALVGSLEQQRREQLPASQLQERRFWRDDQLMKLMRHKNQTGDEHGQS
ncbi:3-hydroxyacyl-CoA dehydrogenase [Bordetella muralis]|jgi:L-gulonate 3-dehydrogenase|uniref:3-hydroxyacyl-CoA dehydrogenase n=1 Tax=Bordetella muralis TaxID=1649130 RepID=UPI0039F140DC